MAEAAFPVLTTGEREIDSAFRIALGDIAGNIVTFEGGLLDGRAPCLMAGLDYGRPWTRDSAINTWNGAGLLHPEVTRNTLVSCLKREDGEALIGGQYWDAIIWSLGAWAQYVYAGDRGFLGLALEATRNSLGRSEAEEFDPETGLFRGAAVYGDGVAAYPDRYAKTAGGSSGILEWPAANPNGRASAGYGLPMQALSTNCVYCRAYEVAARMATELGESPDPSWAGKAAALREAIDLRFWNEEAGRYRYLVDPWGGSDHQEGMGGAFAILFGIADDRKAGRVLEAQHVTPAGVPCVWPTFERYRTPDGHGFGRHSGTVWPHVQGFWAEAAARSGRVDLFADEMRKLARHASRDAHFTEIYHPETTLPYGGRQEVGPGSGMPVDRKGIGEWRSSRRQTWSATAFVRMVLTGLFGARFGPEGIAFEPAVPEGIGRARLAGLRYRDMELSLEVEGRGARVVGLRVDGAERDEAFLPSRGEGAREVAIVVQD